jgi:hypothetical protein
VTSKSINRLKGDLSAKWANQKAKTVGSDNDINHEAVYELTTKVLGLDIFTCKNLGLKLVVSIDEPFYIGLASSLLDNTSRTVLNTACGTPGESGYALTRWLNWGIRKRKLLQYGFQ